MPLIWIRKVAWLTKVIATSWEASAASSFGTPLFSTQAGHRLRRWRIILRMAGSEGARISGNVGLTKRRPSK